MNILQPPHHISGKHVDSWEDIRNDAFDMLELLNTGGFGGLYQDGFALSHAQVSQTPYRFFVTHKSWDNVLPRVVCNARILDASDPQTFLEACLSFPHRQTIKTKRYWSIDVEFDVPPIDGIKSLLGLDSLTKRQAHFDGLAAYLFQHEIDHANGKNVYTK